MIQNGEMIIAGVSGGADSVCLLFLLCRLQKSIDFRLKAVHIHHMIRGEEADRDAAFVKELCERFQVPLLLEKTDVPALAKRQKQSLEEAGREARYAAFCKAAKEFSGKIAVAHHREDNAETVLLNLARGGGIRGLSGIRPVSETGGCTVIRPLLFESRKEIEACLKEQGIPFCEDGTNADTGYLRNAVRHRVLPELSAVNEQAAAHIAKTAQMLGEIEDYLERETEKAFSEAVLLCGTELVVLPEKLKEQDPVLQKRIVHLALAKAAGARKDLASSHVEAVRALAFLQSGRRISLPYGLTAFRQFDQIIIRKEEAETVLRPAEIRKEEIGETETLLSLSTGLRLGFRKAAVNDSNRALLMEKNQYTKAFDYDKILGVIKVGEKHAGDVIELKSGRKPLKRLFIDEKIPLESRRKIPVLKDNERVIWVVGSRICESCKITDETKTALIIRADGGEHECEY